MMKIIDDKGRLFGKINIIDLLVILFLLSLTPMFYFSYKIFSRKQLVLPTETRIPEQPKQPKNEFIEIRAKGKLVKVKPEIIGLITIGDKELDSDGNLIGEIINIEEFEPYILKIKIAPNKELHRQNSDLKQVMVTLKINAEVKGQNIYYKSFKIFEGDTFDFSTGKYTVTVGELLISDNLGQ